MERAVKCEPIGGNKLSRNSRAEPVNMKPTKVKREYVRKKTVDSGVGESATKQDAAVRRFIRSEYQSVMNQVKDCLDDISSVGSDKFKVLLDKVENLQQQVMGTREQVSDAETLLVITDSLKSAVKSLTNQGATPSNFITGLLQDYGQRRGGATIENSQYSICWKDVGDACSHIFKIGQGCRTMLGPMSTEAKQRKAGVRGKRMRPTATARPEQLDGNDEEERSDTDKNMSTMFDILKMKKHVGLESLILNRNSFAQTVENLFSLSFLVKDGRVEIDVDENGTHIVSPRNAPSAYSVTSGEVKYTHFIFRLDFKDWKLMKDHVPIGDELMPHRHPSNVFSVSQVETATDNSQAKAPTTQIKKLSRNHGAVVLEQSVEDSPKTEDTVDAKVSALHQCKRKFDMLIKEDV